MAPSFVNFSPKCIHSHLCGHMEIILAPCGADDGHVTHNYGVEVEFNQSSHARHRDRNMIGGMLGYVKKI